MLILLMASVFSVNPIKTVPKNRIVTTRPAFFHDTTSY
jgi:hypothetical protein